MRSDPGQPGMSRIRARRALAAVLALALGSEPVVALPADPPRRPVLPDLGDSASDDLSPSAERKLGDEIMRQAHEAGDILEDPECSEYLEAFGANLVAHLAPAEALQYFRFFLVDDPSINAFALPGGNIGVNSGLIVATQSESELASVLAHEMGHVLQRHIARAIARQKQTNLMTLATTLLGILAAARAHSSDAGQAALAGSQGYAIQDQLNFGRDAEREADRVGFQILGDADFEVDAMATFFIRLQSATRVDDSGAPAFLQTHPLTTERIADIQDRARDARFRQRVDSRDFQLIRARLRVLQSPTAQGLRDTRAAFEDQLKNGAHASEAAIRYGLAVVLVRQRDFAAARRELDRAAALLGSPDAIVANLSIDLLQAAGDAPGAVAQADQARRQFPQSRVIARHYAETLQQAGRHGEAIAFLLDQMKLYRGDPVLFEMIARSYAAEGALVTSHRMLGEGYLLRGSFAAALEQMRIARRSASADGDFFELSQIDARVRELQAKVVDQVAWDKRSASQQAVPARV